MKGVFRLGMIMMIGALALIMAPGGTNAISAPRRFLFQTVRGPPPGSDQRFNFFKFDPPNGSEQIASRAAFEAIFAIGSPDSTGVSSVCWVEDLPQLRRLGCVDDGAWACFDTYKYDFGNGKSGAPIWFYHIMHTALKAGEEYKDVLRNWPMSENSAITEKYSQGQVIFTGACRG